MIKITIPLQPVTKKNSQRIVYAGRRPLIKPSAAYEAYEKACALYVHRRIVPIDIPVNVKCIYYMPTHRRVDLVNLQEATLDILVKYGVLDDDNSQIVCSMDGSRVFYSKEEPRSEIEITPIEGKEGEQIE